MLFSVTFEGNETVMIPYNIDLVQSEPFIQYVNNNILLFPLRTTAALFKRYLVERNKIPIYSLTVGENRLLHLRYYDKYTLSWYDKLLLPNPTQEYYVKINTTSWKNNNHTSVVVFVSLFNSSIILSAYEVMVFVVSEVDLVLPKMVVVTLEMEEIYQKLSPWVQH